MKTGKENPICLRSFVDLPFFAADHEWGDGK